MVMPKNLHSCESSFSDDALAPLMTALQQEHPRTGAVDMDDDFEMEKRVLDAILDESLDGIVEEVLAEVERTEYLFEFDLN